MLHLISKVQKNNYILIVIALTLDIFFVRFDGFIVNLAMPTFVKIFGVTISQATWIALAYFLAQVSAVMILGKFCSRVKLKSMFIAGMVVFTATSFLCGIANNLWLLVFFRCLQGCGGSMMLVSAFPAVAWYVPKEKIGWATGLITTSAALGVLLGPMAGGLILNYLSWHWIFLINVPLGILAIIYCQKVIPDTNPPLDSSAKGFDYSGAAFSVLAFFLLIYSLNMGREQGWGSPLILGCLIFGVLSLLGFYYSQRHAKDPLLEMSLFNDRTFVLANLAMVIGLLPLFGGQFLLPFYLTLQGYLPKEIGFLLMVFPLIYIPIGLLAGNLSDKVPSARIATVSMGLATLTGLIFAFTLGLGKLLPVIIYLALMGISYGFFFSPINHLILNFATKEKGGSVSAVFNTGQNISIVLGVAVFETFFSQFANPFKGLLLAYIIGAILCLISFLMLGVIAKNSKEAE